MIESIRNMVNRGRAYKVCLGNGSAEAETVLADLARFCRAGKSSIQVGMNGSVDPMATAVAEGRREVWLRIQAALALSDRDIFALQERLKENNSDE